MPTRGSGGRRKDLALCPALRAKTGAPRRGHGERLLFPGPNPMGLLRTILVGLAGSFLGGLVARLAFGLRYRYSLGLGFVLSVLFAALLVYAFEPRSPRRRF